MAKQSFDSS